jgi:2-hydroxychromene-2-carboxylate isomerase
MTTTAKTFEFWYDFSSPFSYLASTQVEALAARSGAEITWRPFLLGGLFKMIGGPDVPMLTWPDTKRQHALRDMARHADLYGVPFGWPTRFPMSTVTALRMTLGAGERAVPLTHAIFRAYWGEDRDISDPAELTRLAESVGLPASLVARTKEQDLKDALRTVTEEAKARDLFGAPSFVVGDLVFWGQDRMQFVEKALAGWRPASG